MSNEEAIEFGNMWLEMNADAKDSNTYTFFQMALEALEQEDNLDKIRAEIEDLDIFYDNDYFSSNRDAMFKCSDVLQIIDKYRK